MSKIDEFKKKYNISSESEEKTSSGIGSFTKKKKTTIEEFKEKYSITPSAQEPIGVQNISLAKRGDTASVISRDMDKIKSRSTGLDGYNKYLEDEEAKKATAEAEKEDEKWWETLGRWLGGGGAVDTTLPTAGVTQTIHDLRADTSYARPQDDWTRDQKVAFGELYLTSPELAYEYAEKTNKENNERKEEREIEEIKKDSSDNFFAGVGHTLGSVVTAPFGLVDVLGDLAMGNAGREITDDGHISPYEYSQAVREGISTKLNEKSGTIDEKVPIIGGKGLGDLYGLGTSIVDSMASGYTLGGAGTLVNFFGQAAASGIDEAKNRGASDDQAVTYGIAAGVFEGVAEMIGIDNLFKLGSSTTIKGLIKNILNQAKAEGLEEGLTSILNNIADAWVLQDKSSFEAMINKYVVEEGMRESDAKWRVFWESLEGIAFDTIAGAFSGGVSGSIQTGIQTGFAIDDANQTYGSDPQSLVTESLELDPNNEYAQKMQSKLEQGKKVSGFNLGHLVEMNENALVTQDKAKMKAAAEETLIKYGEKGDVSKIAEVIAKTRSGEKLTKAEQDILVNSTYGRRVSTEMNPDMMETGEYNSAWAENIGTERINEKAYNKGASTIAKDLTPKHVMTSADKDDPTKEIATEAKIGASEKVTIERDGKEVEAKIARIASIDNGEISFELEGGDVVKASDVNYGAGMGLVYQAASDMASRVGGFNVDTANVFVSGFNPEAGLTAAEYVHGFRDAYRFGATGYPVTELESGTYTSRLSEEQRTKAYNLGKAFGNDKVTSKQATISKKGKVAKKGKLHFDGSVVGKSLTERQKASLKGLRTIAEAMGIDIHIFESALVDGKRQGENGWYDPSDNSIHIDLYAGVKGDSLMLFTAAHELTHHIREISPAKFKIFADALLDEYSKYGHSIEELIQNKMEVLKGNGRITENMTEEQAYDLAYEEVVADSCEAMLVDSNAIEALSKKIHEKDKGLWQTIKDFIAKLVARIKAAYKGLSPDSTEANYVRDMVYATERLQKLWVDALLDASEVTLGESGVIVDSKTDSASLMSVRDVLSHEDRQKVSKALASRFGVTQSEAMDWLKAETSLASLILNPKYSQYLDYTADANEEAIKSNSDYPQGTVDFSNICKKRRDFTEVMNRVLRNFPNHVFAATDLAKIRTIMEEEGMEVACAICYVEDRRQLDSVVAQNFIDSLALYRNGSKTKPDGTPFNANQLKAFKLIEGDTYTPSIYELISLEGRNSLKAKNPAMEEAWVKFNNARGMQSVRLLLNDAEYKRQILKYTPAVVKRKNDLGGLRIYSFSDAEMFHLIDIIQVITDSATVGLSLQGYTKVNEYARAVKDTGEKLNRSLIPKGDLGYHMENGKVVLDFDTVEGIDINHPDFFDNIDNPNIGNIVIGINATQIKAAMKSKFIDQIIPFHTGQSNEVLGEKGIAAWDNYKDFQSERDAKTKKKSSHQINIYTEVINAAEAEGHPITNKVEFVNKFLEVCRENNLIPRFSDFLDVNENGEYIYTEGYHKFLVDFKTFDQNTGEYLPQMPVKPIFDNDYITKLLTDYVKSQKVKDAELAKAMPKVLDRITKEIVKPSDKAKYSDRDSHGNTLSKAQQKFFKDSKARDEEGNLLVLFHGTDRNQRITEFLTTEGHRTGLWLTTDHETAVTFAGAGDDTKLLTKENSSIEKGGQGVYELYANVKNPFIVDAQAKRYWAIPRPSEMGKGDVVSGEEICIFALENGYDGVILIDVIEGSNRMGTDVIVFSPNQVKYTDNLNPTEGNDIRYSDRASYAPTFYSHMGKVIDGIRLEKMGAGGVVSYLKGRGVKDEEIKWSGIEAFLEGKKSVTKADLQEFVAGSQLQIEEEMSGEENWNIVRDGDSYIVKDKDGNILETWEPTQDPGDPNLVGWISLEGGDIASTIEEIREYTSDWYGNEGSRWSQYRLDGGTNYRELVFKMPDSTYSNRAMRAHWGQDVEGVLAHARIQDFTVDGKKMLFIEELQSDWHNEGREKGYTTEEYEDAVAVYDKLANEYAKVRQAFNKYVRSSEFRSDPDEVSKKKFDWLRSKMDIAEKRMQDAEKDVEALKKKGMGDVPDAPFRDNYHEYVLKRLLRMAAEEGYDSIGWTPSGIQSDRWSDEFAEAYRIEYDQEMPKFLRKYGKKWGAIVGKKVLPHLKAKATLYDVNRELKFDSEKEWKEFVKEELREGGFTFREASQTKFVREDEYLVAYGHDGVECDRAKVTTIDNQVWNMDIPNSMKESVLTEGQPKFSDRNTASFKGKAFWSGSVSLLDGVIEEVHTMEEAEAVDFHHSMYFSSAQVEKMENGENAFFWVDNGKVNGDWRESVPKNIIKRIEEQIEVSPSVDEAREFSDADIKYSIREEAPPKKTKEGYKVFVVKNGKLYPPMVANPNAEDTPVGVWLNADVGTRAPDSKTGRMQVKAGGKGTQGGSGSLAFRPGWHLGETPLATQFDRLNPETGAKELFPENFVWALCDIAADHDYQEEAMSYGYTKNGKFQHSLAGLPKLPADGYYKYRTNPNPDTVPWLITGAMKVKKLLSDAEVNAILAEKGLPPKQRVGGDKTLSDLGLSKYEGKVFSDRRADGMSNRSLLANALESAIQNDIEREKLKQYKEKIDLINSEEQKLGELREQIKELSFAKGPRDTKAIKDLQFEANQAANRINTLDKQLLNLESTKALKGVLQREKEMAYKRAEKRGKEALERYRERAAKTQRELMDRYQESRKRGIESRNKTAMRHKIKDVVNELNNYLIKGTKDKHVPIELQKPVAEALDAVNMDTVGAEERIAKKRAEMMSAKSPEVVEQLAKEIEHIQEMGGNMEAKLSRLKTAYDSIVNSDDPLIVNSHDEVISNSIERVMEVVGDTPLRDMSLYQLEAVYDMYRMVLHSIRNANKAFKAKKSEAISVIANRVMEEVDKLGKKKALQSKVAQTVSAFDWNNQKPVYAFERIGSDTFTEVFNNVRAGEDTWAQDMVEAQAFREEQYKKHKYDSWDFKKRFGFTSTSGKTFELSLDQIMSLYAFSKREQAADHLKYGGIVFDPKTEVVVATKSGIKVKQNLTDATTYNISEETLADIISKLTPQQKAFADEMQDYLSTTMGEKGNEISLEMYGVKLFKEKYYFPLKSAPQYMAKAKEQAQGEVKVKNSGFSKETKPHAKNPIVLSSFMDVWAGHVNEMSMYHAFVLPLEDFYRVYNYTTPSTNESLPVEGVNPAIENAHGAAATSYIEQLLKDLNGGARVDSTVGIINKLTGLFKKSAVFASLSVVIQQPSAIARATSLIDTKYFVGKPSKHKEAWAEVKKYAPVAVIKEMGYFDTGMGKSSTEWLKGDKTWKDKVDDIASKAPALADEYAWCAIWSAVKRETAHNNPKLKTNSDEFLKLVGERFTEVIVKTQVYDSVLSRSANMRSKDTGMKMATAFMAEPTTSLNMLQHALIQGKRGNKKYAAKVVGGVVSSMILNSILVSIVYAGRDDDEDKTYAEKYISTLVEELLDSFNPLTLIPFAKDIVSIVQGYDVERSDMAVITDLINAWNNLDSDNRSVYRKVEDFGGAIASILGLPVKNVMRDVRGMYNTINSFINGERTTSSGIGNAISEAVTGSEKSNGQQLYEAILKGDPEQIERVKGRFEDESKINTAIRKALRENDPRIKEAAQAVVDGDTREYSRLINEIIDEGNFSVQNIKSAIASEVNSMTKDESTESSGGDKSEEAVSIYNASNINSAFESGDTAMAKEIISDLIKTKMANGMTEKEAKSSLRSSMTSHWKPLYIAAWESGDSNEMARIRWILANSGLYGTANDVVSTAKGWLKN